MFDLVRKCSKYICEVPKQLTINSNLILFCYLSNIWYITMHIKRSIFGYFSLSPLHLRLPFGLTQLNSDGYGLHTSPTHHTVRTPLVPRDLGEDFSIDFDEEPALDPRKPKNAKYVQNNTHHVSCDTNKVIYQWPFDHILHVRFVISFQILLNVHCLVYIKW